MRKILPIILITIVPLLFSACGVNQGLSMGDYREDVKHHFEHGRVIDSKKVLVSKDKISIVSGFAVGASVGAVIGSASGGANAIEGAVIGGAVGAISGLATGYAIDGNEAEAYQLLIRSGLNDYTAFVKEDILLETALEFIVREDKSLTNISIQKE